MRKISNLFSLVFLAGMLVSCSLIPNLAPLPTEPTETPAVVINPEPPTALVEPTQDPGRYYNEEGGFSLVLPEGWSVAGPVAVSKDDRSYNLYTLGVDPTVEGGPGISKIVVGSSDQWTPELFVQSQCSTCPANPFEQVTLGGKSGWRTQVGGGDVPLVVTWYFVRNENVFIALAIHEPDTLFPLDNVIQSITFE